MYNIIIILYIKTGTICGGFGDSGVHLLRPLYGRYIGPDGIQWIIRKTCAPSMVNFNYESSSTL